MAVELRCPDCRAKLRLPEAPEAGTDVECPKCGSVFAAPEKAGRKPGDAADEAPKKKTKRADGEEKPAKKQDGGKTEKKEKKKAAGEPQGPKKRKWKKKETNPAALWAVVAGAVLFVGSFAGALIWFFTKKSASQEMMTYLPDDCDEVFGMNVGHLKKYPEFYKSCEATFANTGFKKAGDALAKALGQEKISDSIDYVVQGTGRAGGQAGGAVLEATVFRTAEEFDQGVVAKLPGAQKAGNANGVDFYTAADPGFGYPGMRVFAPTNRLVVFCRGDMPDGKFKAMLTGNKDNPDATVVSRSGQLGKYIIRGTVWKFSLYGRYVPKPAPQPRQGGSVGGNTEPNEQEQLQQEIVSIAAPSQGSGYKASVGSREVRGEWVVWLKDSSSVSDAVKKWREKEWVKDSEKDPPRWFKAMAEKTGAGKTAANAVRDGLAFRSSGELLIFRSSLETKLLQQGIGSLVGAFTGQQGGMGMPGMGGPGGPGGMPGGGPPGGAPGVMPGGPPGGVPGKSRRRFGLRSRR